LSGNLGIETNHFHAGFDFKTLQRSRCACSSRWLCVQLRFLLWKGKFITIPNGLRQYIVICKDYWCH
jgi:hypothetical protein